MKTYLVCSDRVVLGLVKSEFLDRGYTYKQGTLEESRGANYIEIDSSNLELKLIKKQDYEKAND